MVSEADSNGYLGAEMNQAEEDALVYKVASGFPIGGLDYDAIRLAIRAAVAQERERCARNVRALYDEWMQEHGGESAFDAGRLGGLYSAEDAIRKGDS